jgi:hypothetical protein
MIKKNVLAADIGSHYFAPDIRVDIIINYFYFVGNFLDTMNYRILLFGDFYILGLDWNCGLPSPKCYLYTKLKEHLVHSATCFLGLNKKIIPYSGSNLLDLVIFQITLNFLLIKLNTT